MRKSELTAVQVAPHVVALIAYNADEEQYYAVYTRNMGEGIEIEDNPACTMYDTATEARIGAMVGYNGGKGIDWVYVS